MKISYIFSNTFFYSLLILSVNLFAQNEDTLKVYHHDDIVVTATRSEKHASDVSRSLSVISKEEIKNGIHISPLDILSQKEGMSFIGGGQTPGSAQTIFMRGVNSNSTAVLIDGVRINDPSSIGNSLNLSEMSLSNISQIEVIRGAHSTLYGSSAIGGVINFITEKNRKLGFNADISTQMGTFGDNTSLFNQDAFLNYTFSNGLYFNGEIFNSQIAGIDATVDNLPDSVYKTTDHDDFEKLEGSLKVGFINNQWDIFLAYKRTDQNTDIDKFAFVDDDNAYLEFDRDLLTYNINYKFNEKLNFAFTGGYLDMKRSSLDDSSLIDNAGNYDATISSATYKGTTFNNDLSVKYQIENANVLLGIGYNDELMTSKNDYISPFYSSETNLDTLDLSDQTYSFFTHFDLNGALLNGQLNSFNLALGARFINHSTFGNHFTFEFNPSCRLGDALIYSSISSGFNAPSLFRLYNTHYDAQGNPDLKPEKSISLEAGMKYKLNIDHQFFVSVFQNEIENIHEYVSLYNGATPIDSVGFLDYRGGTYLNAGTMIISGLEIGLSSRFNNFLISANASWIDGKQKYTPDDINMAHTQGYHVQVSNNGRFLTGKDFVINGLTRRSNTANFALEYALMKSLSVASLVKYVGRRTDAGGSPVKSYTLLDLNARYQVLKPLQVMLRIENLLDKKYSEILGYNTRGRGFYLGLRYSL